MQVFGVLVGALVRRPDQAVEKVIKPYQPGQRIQCAPAVHVHAILEHGHDPVPLHADARQPRVSAREVPQFVSDDARQGVLRKGGHRGAADDQNPLPALILIYMRDGVGVQADFVGRVHAALARDFFHQGVQAGHPFARQLDLQRIAGVAADEKCRQSQNDVQHH